VNKPKAEAAFVSNDKEALRAYQMREMALSDWTSAVNHARREGTTELLDLWSQGKTMEEAKKILGIE
jgi:hypothetical protein